MGETTSRAGTGRYRYDGIRYAGVGAALCLAFTACAAEVDFRRFEVGPVEPRIVLDAAAEVVKAFYTRVHGGLHIEVEEENLRLSTGYILKRTPEEIARNSPKDTVTFLQPRRERLYLKVIPTDAGSDVEILAVIEVLSIDDVDVDTSADELWTFLVQDTPLEDRIHEKLLERLIEDGLLE